MRRLRESVIEILNGKKKSMLRWEKIRETKHHAKVGRVTIELRRVGSYWEASTFPIDIMQIRRPRGQLLSTTKNLVDKWLDRMVEEDHAISNNAFSDRRLHN